eukprot:1162204-Prymnesium_polylepis.1
MHLNPAVYFRSVVRDAHAVVLAGGTMQPIADLEQQVISGARTPRAPPLPASARAPLCPPLRTSASARAISARLRLCPPPPAPPLQPPPPSPARLCRAAAAATTATVAAHLPRCLTLTLTLIPPAAASPGVRAQLFRDLPAGQLRTHTYGHIVPPANVLYAPGPAATPRSDRILKPRCTKVHPNDSPSRAEVQTASVRAYATGRWCSARPARARPSRSPSARARRPW